MMKTPRTLAALVVTALFAIAGCGGGGDDSGGTPNAEKATKAKAAGNVTWCIGKDTTGASRRSSKLQQGEPEGQRRSCWSCRQSPTISAAARSSASGQVDRVRRARHDVIWTAEFAAQGWLKDVSDYISQNARTSSSRRPLTPQRTTASTGPSRSTPTRASSTTGQDEGQLGPDDLGGRSTRGRRQGRHRLPGLRYEGLTVTSSSCSTRRAAARSPTTARRPTIDSPQAQECWSSWSEGIKDGAAPKAVTDLHGGGVAQRIRVRQRRASAQLAVRLLARQEGRRSATSSTSRRSRSCAGGSRAPACSAATTSASRPTRRTPRALASSTSRRQPRQQKFFATESSLPAVLTRPTTTPASRRSAVRDQLQDRDRAGQAAAGLAGVPADLRGDLQQRLRGAVQGKSPETRRSKMNDQINKALKTF